MKKLQYQGGGVGVLTHKGFLSKSQRVGSLAALTRVRPRCWRPPKSGQSATERAGARRAASNGARACTLRSSRFRQL